MKSFWLLGSAHVVQLACSLLGTILIFRSLSPTDVGTVVLIIAFNGVLIAPLASAFAKIYSALLVEPHSDRRAEQLYWLGWCVVSLMALLMAGICALLYGDPIYALMAGLLGSLGVHKLNLRHAENAGMFTRIALVRISVGLVLLGVKAFAALRVSPYLFAASFVSEQLIYFLAFPVRGQSGPLAILRDWRAVVRVPQLRSVLKQLPTEFAAGLSLKYPMLMFGALSMPEAAALYNAATRLPEAFNGLLMSLFAAIRPRAYREAAETEPAQFPYRSTNNFVQKGIWLTLMAMIVVPIIMPWLFGDFYKEARLGTALYFFVSLTILMGVVQEVWMISSRLFRLSAMRVLLGAATSVTFTSVFFPIFGLEGAILGVLMGTSVQAVVSNLIFARLRTTAFPWQLRQLRSAFWPFGKKTA